MKNLLNLLLPFSCLLIFSCIDGEEAKPKGTETPTEGCIDEFSFNYGDILADTCFNMHGCSGYLSGMANSGTVGYTLYNDEYDKLIHEEANLLEEFFQDIHELAILILYEPSPEHANCYASSDGTILIGYHFAWGTAEAYGELVVAGIMAHEFGHQVQFDMGWSYEHKFYQAILIKEKLIDGISPVLSYVPLLGAVINQLLFNGGLKLTSHLNAALLATSIPMATLVVSLFYIERKNNA